MRLTEIESVALFYCLIEQADLRITHYTQFEVVMIFVQVQRFICLGVVENNHRFVSKSEAVDLDVLVDRTY